MLEKEIYKIQFLFQHSGFCSGHLLFLNRVKEKFERGTRKTVVEFIALICVNYSLPDYGTTNATLLRRVQQLQNLAAKICIGGARRSDYFTPFIDQLQ